MTVTNDEIAARLQQQLQLTGHQIVFAESCTAGLIAATLGRIPGISQWLAGSAVVYQLATKSAWLDVDADLLQNPGPVSEIVSQQMASGVLQLTPHATIAASVTGHLGPDAPPEQDGTAWSTVAIRTNGEPTLVSKCLLLDELLPSLNDEVELRQRRQAMAVRLVMQFCVDAVKSNPA